MLKKGYIQVYTGDGKGKTTAAFGLALRSWGHNRKVCIIQFMKKDTSCGEYKAFRRLGKNFLVKQFGRGCFVMHKPSPVDKALAQEGLDYARRILRQGRYNLVILDEINCALHWGLLDNASVKKVLDIKPNNAELVLTGRYAPDWLLKRADLVTEMKEKKHYFRKGVKSRLGIEY